MLRARHVQGEVEIGLSFLGMLRQVQLPYSLRVTLFEVDSGKTGCELGVLRCPKWCRILPAPCWSHSTPIFVTRIFSTFFPLVQCHAASSFSCERREGQTVSTVCVKPFLKTPTTTSITNPKTVLHRMKYVPQLQH